MRTGSRTTEVRPGSRVLHDAHRSSGGAWVRAGVGGGLAAGIAMASFVMLYGLLFEEDGAFFDAPMAIWAWLFGAEHYGDAANHVGPIVLGIGAHMTNALVVGLAFAAIAAAVRVREIAPATVLAVAYALVVWILMRFVVLPLNEEEARMLTSDTVAPQWVWWLAHVAFGITLGVVFARLIRGRELEDGQVREVELRRAA